MPTFSRLHSLAPIKRQLTFIRPLVQFASNQNGTIPINSLDTSCAMPKVVEVS